MLFKRHSRGPGESCETHRRDIASQRGFNLAELCSSDTELVRVVVGLTRTWIYKN